MAAAAPVAGWRRWAWVVPGTLAAGMTGVLAGQAAQGGAAPGESSWWHPSAEHHWWALAYLVLVIVTVATAGLRRARPRTYAYEWAIVLAALTVVLGTAAYWPYRGAWSLVAFVTWVLNLFTGQTEAGLPLPEPHPLGLQLARLFGLGTIFLTAAAAAARLSRDQVDRWWIRRARDLDVIAGLDHETLPLVKALLDERAAEPRLARWYRPRPREVFAAWWPRRSGVAVIHPNPEDPLLGEVRQLGARVFVGDPGEPGVLGRVLLTRGGIAVRRFYAATPAQRANVDAVTTAVGIVEAQASGDWLASGNVPRLIARFDDPRQARDWRLAHLDAAGCFVDGVSSDELVARRIVGRIVDSGCQEVVVVGDTALTIALLDELALQRAFRYEVAEAHGGGVPGRAALADGVRVAGRRADLAVAEWREHRTPAADIPSPLVVTAVAGSWEEVAASACRRGRPTAFVITGSPSAEVNARATRITRTHPDSLVFCPADGVSGVEPAEEGALFPNETVVRFGPTLLDEGGVPQDSWTVLARQQHQVYIAARRGAATASRRPWDGPPGEALPDFFREDTLRQQRLLLRLVGQLGGEATGRAGWVRIGPADVDLGPLPEPLVEAVARAEHERWCALREAHGWTPARPSRPLDRLAAEQARQNANLRRWEDGLPRRAPADWTAADTAALPPVEELRAWNIELVQRLVRRLFWWGIAPAASLGPRLRYRRVGEVIARRSAEAFAVTTAGADVLQGRAGDWLVASGGVTRPVSAEEFPELYRPSASGSDRYERVGTVTAWPARRPGSVRTLEGEVQVSPGMWVVEDARGNRWAMPAEQFAAGYVVDA